MFQDYIYSIYTHLNILKFKFYTSMDCGGTRLLFRVTVYSYNFCFIRYLVIPSNPSFAVELGQIPGEVVDRLFLYPKK